MAPLLSPQVDQRIQNVQAFFNSGDLDTIREVIRQYNVKYIVVGSLERAHASQDTLSQFETMAANGELERVFVSGDDVLYRVAALGDGS